MDRYLQQALHKIEQVTSGVSVQQLARRSAEGKWSPAEVLEHLTIAFSSTSRHLKKCLAVGNPSATPPSLRHRAARFLIVRLGYFPPGRKAPEFTNPTGAPPGQAVENIKRELAIMDEVITECEERFGSRIAIANHPILGPLNVQGWRKFHYVHTRHHMRQIAALQRSAK